MKKLLIAFEGLPGAGKTTLARDMAILFDGEFMEEIVVNDKFRPDQDEYYIESELIKLRRFVNSKKRLNFFDRSFYSMRGYNYGRKMVGLSHILETIDSYILGTRKPDLFVYLRVGNVDLCNKRKTRDVNEADVWTRRDSLKQIRDYYDSFFKKEKNQITIDTDDKSMDEVKNLLIDEIKNYV